MSDRELRLTHLHQIPVFALKGMLKELAKDQAFADRLTERFEQVFDRKPHSLESAITECTRAQLVALIRVCPEIRPEEITQLFREYRYAKSPSFHLYQFKESNLDLVNRIDELMDILQQHFKSFEAIKDGRIITGLELLEMMSMPDQSGIVESNVRYLKRLDYVDSDEEAILTYQTIYGFFWINCIDRYVTIHASAKEIREAVKLAVENALDCNLEALRLPKELQKMIPFLGEDSMTYGRLYNPDPNSQNFTSVAIRDANLMEKGYPEYENAYPNVRLAHYKDKVGQNGKKTTVVVSEAGSLRVYGNLTAGQFRSWCLERLRLITITLQHFRRRIDAYASGLDFQSAPELNELGSEKQRLLLTKLITVLAALKRFPGLTQYPSGVSALELAVSFGEMVYLRIPYSCQHFACQEEGCLTCPTCNGRRLILRKGNVWTVECPHHTDIPFATPLPLAGFCDHQHSFLFGHAELENTIEIFFERKLLRIMSSVINNNIPGCEVDFEQEMIYLWGTNVVFHPKKSRILRAGGDTYYVTVKNSKATAVGPNSRASSSS